MQDVIINAVIIAILLAIVGGIIRYLYKAKRRGETCIGCPCSKQCGGKCSGCNQVNTDNKENHD